MRNRARLLFWTLFWVALLMPSLDAEAQTAGKWNPTGWIDDLHLIKQTLITKYANLQWLTQDREVNLDSLFADTEARIRASGSDAGARAALDRLIRRIDDGHVGLDWPTAISTSGKQEGPRDATAFCSSIGYTEKRGAADVAEALAGYAPLAGWPQFPTGTISVAGHRVGLLRIEVFMPQFNPSLCVDAVRELKIPTDAECADACQDKIEAYAYRQMTQGLEQNLRALSDAGAELLIVDLTNNGGGSEWAEAVARMLTSRRLLSEKLGFVRGEHWKKHWTELAKQLSLAAQTASPADAKQLRAWAAEAEQAAGEASKTCSLKDNCAWLGKTGYSTGLVGEADSSHFAGKPWGELVFTPAEYSYRDAAWTKPVVVLVDQGTASAAEEFSAVLQDNHAALVAGSRTMGIGCGHTDGGTPTLLPHSGATLEVPDCARFRADGTNEVFGIFPDIQIPWKSNDGPRLKSRLLEDALPEIVQRALAGGPSEAPVGPKTR